MRTKPQVSQPAQFMFPSSFPSRIPSRHMRQFGRKTQSSSTRIHELQFVTQGSHLFLSYARLIAWLIKKNVYREISAGRCRHIFGLLLSEEIQHLFWERTQQINFFKREAGRHLLLSYALLITWIRSRKMISSNSRWCLLHACMSKVTLRSPMVGSLKT